MCPEAQTQPAPDETANAVIILLLSEMSPLTVRFCPGVRKHENIGNPGRITSLPSVNMTLPAPPGNIGINIFDPGRDGREDADIENT